MIHGDVSADLLRTIFMPRSALHDGAVIIRDDRIVAAGALLPLAETSIHTERFGTRHRAALGITEQTDAVVVVVSEENGQISLVERARIVRNLTEGGLARAIQGLLDPAGGRADGVDWRIGGERDGGSRAPRIRELGRFVGRSPAAVVATPAAVANPGPEASTVAMTRNAETTASDHGDRPSRSRGERTRSAPDGPGRRRQILDCAANPGRHGTDRSRRAQRDNGAADCCRSAAVVAASDGLTAEPANSVVLTRWTRRTSRPSATTAPPLPKAATAAQAGR